MLYIDYYVSGYTHFPPFSGHSGPNPARSELYFMKLCTLLSLVRELKENARTSYQQRWFSVLRCFLKNIMYTLLVSGANLYIHQV